jgi:hypothetical protein
MGKWASDGDIGVVGLSIGETKEFINMPYTIHSLQII